MQHANPKQKSRWRMVLTAVSVVMIAFIADPKAQAADPGAAKSFAVLSTTDVTLRNRVAIAQANASPASCPGSVGCPGSIGGTTVLMGRGNASAPDTISGNVIASANSSQGLNCANNPPGTTAICLGNDSEVTGMCVTGNGAVSSPSECAAGSDTTGTNSLVTTLLPQAASDAASLASTLAAMAPTQTLPAITLGPHGSFTITSNGSLNVVSVPSISTGTKATITISGGASDVFVINVGNSTDAGSLQLGNGAAIVLAGQLTPDRVIFNLIGSSTTVQPGNDNTFNGTILAPQGQFTSGDGDTPSPVLINGALLVGGSVAIGNNTNLNFYPFARTGSGTGTSSPS